ncbi:MAG: SH3 domain-containing protein [Acutalibacter sp.]|nr:SH3 domain-containing protein [Acutalibacter sp.]
MTKRNPMKKRLCLFLAVLMLVGVLPVLGLSARAAGTPTSLGLAQHGLDAYNDGWQYSFGSKGETINGVRYSDCAGLLYAYFSDLGVGGCAGGATSQVNQNCIFSGSIDEGVPRIHGLAVTVFDRYDPESGIYGHIGIYIGNNEAVDNSDYGTNMVRGSVYTRDWGSWHLFDNGVMYPRNGWFEFDGKMVHYTNYEYDVNTNVEGYDIGEDGFAQMNGQYAPVEPLLLSNDWAPASEVRDWLSSMGWSGTDNYYPEGPSDPGTDDPGNLFSYDAQVSATSVNLRSEATTASSVVAVLHKGAQLQLEETVEGGQASVGGQTSTTWYKVTTSSGISGYISSLLIEVQLPTVSITSSGEAVSMSAGNANIYYTTDGSEPTLDSDLYAVPIYQLGVTYKAMAVKGTVPGPVSVATVLSNGALFTDFTYANWYAETIDEAVARGIFKGTGDNMFSPNMVMTRAQFITALSNISGEDVNSFEFTDGGFTDVTGGYYYHPVAWATSKGIITGGSGAKFNPNDPITREQMCVMLSRYMDSLGMDEPTGEHELFADHQDISGYARDAVYRLRAYGVVNGMGGNKFEPTGTANRATACTVLIKFIHEVMPEEAGNVDMGY